MDKSYPSKTPMVVRSLDMEKDPFRPRDDDEEILGPEFPYLSAIGALMYLANCTRLDIAFAVNLLARHSAVTLNTTCHELRMYFDIPMGQSILTWSFHSGEIWSKIWKLI